jgi:hypothetical protein
MEPLSEIPTVAMLAYRYGTIKKNEFELVNKLYNENLNKPSFNDILINQGFATEYQVGLLGIIQDYYIIQQQGIEFGKIAVEHGFATKQDIEKALVVQKDAFKKAKVKKLIGDILVESKVITLQQRDQVLKEQKKFEKIKEKVLLGDVLVNQGIISNEQKDIVLVEQKMARQKKTEKRLKEKSLDSFPLRISFAVSDDCMEALVLIEKYKKNGKNITLNEIKTKLTQDGIKYGVFSDSIIQCYIDKKYTVFPVAKGAFPLEHNGQAINYFFKTSNIKKDQIKKGTPLAEQKISGIGLVGKDVFSKSIERDKLKNTPVSLMRCGSGTRFSKDNKKVFAKKTGLPSLSITNKLYIHPILNILEDADLRYGKIEAFADINISGTLSDAYPVTAGNLKATEIRGTKIKAQGNISVALGITGAKIRCQGNIQAKYIKNSIIEAYGDVNVQHEIIDSEIIISGKLKGQKARVIASSISAKNSIDIGSCGSRVTEPSTLSAGRDDHALLKSEQIDAEIIKLKAELDELRDQREHLIKKEDLLFKKMVQLKLFHDKTEKKKKKIEEQFADIKNKNKSQKIIDPKNDKKTQTLLNKLKNKMKISVNSLKALNNDKKKITPRLKQIENRVEKIKPGIEKSVAELERDRTLVLMWASGKSGKPEINIKAKASETTIIKGIFSEKVLQKDFRNIIVKESKTVGKADNYSLKIFKG